jgi:hypothetical protein
VTCPRSSLNEVMSKIQFIRSHRIDNRHDLGTLLGAMSIVCAIETKHLRKRYTKRARNPHERLERWWRMAGFDIRNLSECHANGLSELALRETALLPECPDDLAQFRLYCPIQGLNPLLGSTAFGALS